MAEKMVCFFCITKRQRHVLTYLSKKFYGVEDRLRDVAEEIMSYADQETKFVRAEILNPEWARAAGYGRVKEIWGGKYTWRIDKSVIRKLDDYAAGCQISRGAAFRCMVDRIYNEIPGMYLAITVHGYGMTAAELQAYFEAEIARGAVI